MWRSHRRSWRLRCGVCFDWSRQLEAFPTLASGSGQQEAWLLWVSTRAVWEPGGLVCSFCPWLLKVLPSARLPVLLVYNTMNQLLFWICVRKILCLQEKAGGCGSSVPVPSDPPELLMLLTLTVTIPVNTEFAFKFFFQCVEDDDSLMSLKDVSVGNISQLRSGNYHIWRLLTKKSNSVC